MIKLISSTIKGLMLSFMMVSGTIIFMLGANHASTIFSNSYIINMGFGCLLILVGTIFIGLSCHGNN